MSDKPIYVYPDWQHLAPQESWKPMYINTRERTIRNDKEKIEIIMGNQKLIFLAHIMFE